MKNVLFVKYNRTRKPAYQISTSVYEQDNTVFVEKKALEKEAIPHIESLKDKSEKLGATLSSVSVLMPQIEGKSAFYKYIDGITLEDKLVSFVNNKELFLQEIKKANDRIFDFNNDNTKEFEATELFVEIFGEVKGLDGNSVSPANIDCLYDNFIEENEVMYCLDCEWVVDTYVPVEYLLYRSLFYFYRKFKMYLEKVIAEEEFLECFGINAHKADIYFEMEDNYQHYIHGPNGESIYTDNYKKPIKSRDNLEEDGFDLSSFKQLQDKDKDITNLNELCHIKDNTIKDKDQYIQDLEAIITNMRSNPMYKIGRAPVKVVKKFRGLFQKKNLTNEKIEFVYEENPKVTIIIPVYNQFVYTYDCLKSIKENTPDISYEIIVADDVSTDKTKFLTKLVKNITVIRNVQNLGFLKNCNNAAKVARGEYLLFLNNNTTVTRGWLEPLVSLMERDSSIGLTGSKLIYPNGILQEAGGVIWSNGDGWNYGRNDMPDKPEYNYVRETDYISGAAMMIRHSLWKKIGGFDERFAPAYYEDTDLAFSVRKEGMKVIVQPQSRVIHYEGMSNGTDTGSGIKKYQVENKAKFIKKWQEELKNQCDTPNDLFIARDGSNHKKIAVVIDRYVPQFDKDAGSKSTLSYIKAFIKMGYNVKFIPDDFKADGVYTTYLEQLGVEVLTGSFYLLNIDKWIEDYGKHFDIVFANRPFVASKYLDVLKSSIKGKLTYYGHDLHYARTLREYKLTRDKSLLAHANQMKKLEYAVMEQADVVFYPSFLEIVEIAKEAPTVNAVAIPVFVYEEPNERQPLDAGERKDLIFVGGFAHDPNADAVRWFVTEVFPFVKKEIPEIRFHVIGSNPTEEIKAMASESVIIHGFVTEEELLEAYYQARVAVVPLRFGAGMKGKVIEALYNNVPLLTTTIGAQGLECYDEVMVVEDESEAFAKALIEMYQDNERLNRMSAAMPDYIAKYFSLEAATKIIQDSVL